MLYPVSLLIGGWDYQSTWATNYLSTCLLALPVHLPAWIFSGLEVAGLSTCLQQTRTGALSFLLPPQSMPASHPHHQSWQWQIYHHLWDTTACSMDIYFHRDSYTGIYHCFVNGYDHMITKLLSPNSRQREMFLRNAWGLLPWRGCLDWV